MFPQKTLYRFLWDNNKNHLDEIVFEYFGNHISYKVLFESIEKTAKALSAMNIKAGDIVTVMSMHTPETIYVMYALNSIGAIANMVYPSLSNHELLRAIKDTNSKAVFILDEILKKNLALIEGVGIQVILLSIVDSMNYFFRLGYRIRQCFVNYDNVEYYSRFLERGARSRIDSAAGNPDSLAVVVYTSGTTGEPKGVCLSNKCINALATQDYNGIMQFEREKKCLMIIPPFIGQGATQIHIMASAGITQILHVNLEPQIIIKELFRHKPYVFMSGPAFAPAFLEHSVRNLKNLRYFISGGGALTEQQNEDINEMLHACGTDSICSNGYGMTEASSLLCASANEISKKNSVGIPFICTNVRIVDNESGEDLRYGEIGELWFSTPNLMDGYLNNRNETEKVISLDEHGVRWLHTGDLGTVDEDGFVFIKGRLKRIYITRGNDNMAYKLFPQRIEDTFLTIGEISSCGVIVREDAKRMNVAVAYVLPKDKIYCNNNGLKESLIKKVYEIAHAELPEHMQPVAIHIVDYIPTTPSGKIDYKELEKVYDRSEKNN